MKLGDRLDGHIVQGHVDQIGTCIQAQETNGSWSYTFEYDESLNNLTIEKGSITVNGVTSGKFEKNNLVLLFLIPMSILTLKSLVLAQK
jgi:riboflavin synthase alpha subunit